jgi:hypothetical protein
MKHLLAVATFWLLSVWSASAEAPVKVTVHQLLAHPRDYDRRLVDVSGYYTCGEHESDLWPDAPTAKRASGREESVYIDPVTWDPRFHPKRSRDIFDPWHVTGRRARVIGTFRSGGVRPGLSIPADGPTIVDVMYFRPLR